MTSKQLPSKSTKKRSVMKPRRPQFRRHESWRYKRLKENWRKPRGLDNKMRVKAKGWPKLVNIGYGSPKTSRGLHPSGYEEVIVHTPDEVASVDPETQAIRIGHTVGTRKRIQIASLAREREIFVFNPLVRKEVEEEMEEETEEELDLETTQEADETTAEARKKKASRPRKREKEVKTDES